MDTFVRRECEQKVAGFGMSDTEHATGTASCRELGKRDARTRTHTHAHALRNI